MICANKMIRFGKSVYSDTTSVFRLLMPPQQIFSVNEYQISKLSMKLVKYNRENLNSR